MTANLKIRGRKRVTDAGLAAKVPVRIEHRSFADLAKRLLVGGLVISVLLGGAAFAFELFRLVGSFSSVAVAEANEFMRREGDLIEGFDGDESALQATLEAFVSARWEVPEGHFVLAEIYDPSHRLIAGTMHEGAVEAETRMDAHPHRFPADTRPYTRLIMVGRTPYVQVLTTLRARDELIGFFEGAYMVSPSAVRRLLVDAARTSTFVALAVLANTILLYPIIRKLDRRLVEAAFGLLHANFDSLSVLGGAIAKRDGKTGSHSYRVTLIAIRLAEAAGLEPGKMRGLIKGAFLHDVGKIAIADAILLKPGPLTQQEAEAMRHHVRDGLEIIAQADWLADAGELLACHHERFDGSGYPNGLAGEQIPITARIFAIADVFDALTSERAYKRPLPLPEVVAVLREGRGRHFDPVLLDIFLAMAERVYSDVCIRNEQCLRRQLQQATSEYFAETILL